MKWSVSWYGGWGHGGVGSVDGKLLLESGEGCNVTQAGTKVWGRSSCFP